MTVLRQEQIEMRDEMIRAERVSGRQAAALLQVSEGGLRYRRKRLASGARDRRAEQATALDGFEAVVTTVLDALAPTVPEGRAVCGRLVFEALVRDHDHTGSYPALIRYLGRLRGRAPVQAVRRVELPPGMQAQHDWLEERVALAGSPVRLFGLLGTLAHSRGSALWLGLRMTQVAWQAGHAALFQSYGGVPRVVRIDNRKTGVIAGAGPTAVLNPAFATFARMCGFGVDSCRAARGSDKGKAERNVRSYRSVYADLFVTPWADLRALQAALDARSARIQAERLCPITGTPIAAALAAERPLLQPLPAVHELFDCVVARRVSRDCLVSLESRRYSVPFAWVGRQVEVRGTATQVVIVAAGQEIARHPGSTRHALALEPTHYEGESTATVRAPTPLGRRAQLQLAAIPHAACLPAPDAVARLLAQYLGLLARAGTSRPALPERPSRDPSRRPHTRRRTAPPAAAVPVPAPAPSTRSWTSCGRWASSIRRRRSPKLVEEAARDDLSPLAFLDLLLTGQLERKDERRVTTMLKLSGLPPGKTLEDFDWGFQPKADRRQIDALSMCQYLRDKTNVLFLGPPGPATYYVTSLCR